MPTNSNRSTSSRKTLDTFFGERSVDHYAVLGVRRNASMTTIANAHRKLVKQYHPDVNNSPDAAEQFKLVQAAFEALYKCSAATRKRRTRKSDRPEKPKGYKDFPLYAHPTGHWAKKIRGTIYYFGRWGRIRNGKMEHLPYQESWEAALTLYRAQRDDLHAGRTPRAKSEHGLVLAELCDRFLNAKRLRVEARELSLRSYQEYKQSTDRLIQEFGGKRLVTDITASDFQTLRATIAKTCGPIRLGNEITRAKSVFKYGFDNGLIEHAVRFGSEFRKPDRAVMRRHRAASDKKLFTAAELRLMLDALLGNEVTILEKRTSKPKKITIDADPRLRAAILLGINAGAGNTDVANLFFKHLNQDWLHYPRGKTGIDRRIPLWTETSQALKDVISTRPQPKDKADADCVFLSPRRNGDVRSGGTRLVTMGETSRTDYVSRDFSKLLRALHINGRRGLGFYSLRHTFATVALQTGDRDAVKSLMGHADGDILSAYDETGPSDERLKRVTDHVHEWLFAKGGAK